MERAEVLDMLRKKKLQRQEQLRKDVSESTDTPAAPASPAPAQVDEFGETSPPEAADAVVEVVEVVAPPLPAPGFSEETVEIVAEAQGSPVQTFAEPVEPPPEVGPVIQTYPPETAATKAQVLTRRVYTHLGKIVNESSEDSLIEVGTFVTTPASVRFGYGNTVNIGDFNGAKIYVEVSLPCYVEEVDEALACAKGIVEEKMDTEMQELVK